MDVKNKLIRKYEVSSAEVHDSRKAVDLPDENNSNRDTCGDSAYTSGDFLAELEKRKLRDRLNRKGYRNKALTEKTETGQP